MTAAKPKPAAKPAAPAKTAAPKGKGLKIHPDRAHEALEVLAAYVAERAELVKEKGNFSNTVEAIKMMNTLKQLAEAIAERIKSPAEEAYNMMRFNHVPSFMEDEEITKISVEDIGRVNVMDDLRLSVKDKKALHDWLVENDLEDMITSSVNAQTLTAFFRNRIKEGKQQDGEGLPDPKIVEVTPFVRAQITKG